jgi:hypothetical protein
MSATLTSSEGRTVLIDIKRCGIEHRREPDA